MLLEGRFFQPPETCPTRALGLPRARERVQSLPPAPPGRFQQSPGQGPVAELIWGAWRPVTAGYAVEASGGKGSPQKELSAGVQYLPDPREPESAGGR